MIKTSLTPGSGRRHSFVPAAIVALGALLLILALARPKTEEPKGWVAVNGTAERALAALNGPPAGGGGGAGENASAKSGRTDSAGKPDAAAEPAPAGGTALNGSGSGKIHPHGGAAKAVQSSGINGADSERAGAAAVEDAGAAAVEDAGAAAASDAAAAGGEAPAASGPGQAGHGSAEPADDRLDINRATAAELDELPGIGAAKAKAIVEERERSGFFRSEDDLLRVKGIGPKLLEKMKPVIVVNP